MSSQIAEVVPLEVTSFIGGITDSPIAGRADQYEMCDNIDITDDGKIRTRSGIGPAFGANSRITSGNRLTTVLDNKEEIWAFESNIGWAYNSGWNLFQGVSANATWVAPSDARVNYASWNNAIIACSEEGSRVKTFYKSGGFYIYQNLGLPTPVDSITFSGPAMAGGTKGYAYKVHFEYQFEMSGQQYKERSAVFDFAALTNCKDINTTDTITLSLGAAFTAQLAAGEDSYLAGGIKAVIYRNTANGTTWYKLTTVDIAAGTTYVDSVTDAQLSTTNREVLYTGLGVLDYDQPPKSKCVAIVDEIAYFGAIYQNGQWEDNVLAYSIPSMIFAVPGSFRMPFDHKIVAISNIGSYPIVFTLGGIYRIEGRLDQFGAGRVVKRKISDMVVESASSLIKLDEIIYFFSQDGFCGTTAQRAFPITSELNETAASIISSNKQKYISGSYDSTNKRLVWLVPNNGGNNDSSVAFVGHLKFTSNNTVPFTTYSGFELTDVHFFKGSIYCSNRFGHLLKVVAGLRVDYIPDVTISPELWNTRAIIYDFIWISTDFEKASVRKWVPWIIINAANDSSLSMAVQAQNDQSGFFKDLSPLQYKGGISWGDPDVVWGDPNIKWQYYPMISAKRHFPSGSLRCMYKQVRFTNAELDNILDGAACTVDAALKTATIAGVPIDATGYFLNIEIAGLKYKFRVTKQVGDILHLSDSLNQLVSGTYAWQFSGVKKGEVLRLISFVIQFNYITSTQDPYFGRLK